MGGREEAVAAEEAHGKRKAEVTAAMERADARLPALEEEKKQAVAEKRYRCAHTLPSSLSLSLFPFTLSLHSLSSLLPFPFFPSFPYIFPPSSQA